MSEPYSSELSLVSVVVQTWKTEVRYALQGQLHSHQNSVTKPLKQHMLLNIKGFMEECWRIITMEIYNW